MWGNTSSNAFARVMALLKSTDNDDGSKGKHLVHSPPLTIMGESNIENHAFDVCNLFRYIPTNLHAGILDRTDTTDLSAYVQNALDNAYTLGLGSVQAPDATYNIKSAGVAIPAGVTLFGTTSGSEYYPGDAAAAVHGALFLKPAAGSAAGPIFIMTTASALRSVYLKHLRANGATTGIVQMGAVGTAVTCYNAKLSDVRIYGDLTTDVTGVNTCYGIYFPQSISLAQRYFNQFNSVYVTNCDVAVHLDEESNGNNFTGIITRQCYHHYELDGNAGACVDNNFSGLGLFNIGSLPVTPEKCFVLSNGAQWNNFIGYQTECNGTAFEIDATSALNMFIGQENETDPSVVPVGGISGPDQGSIHSRYARPINVEQYAQMVLPSLATGAKFDTIIGSKFSSYQRVDGAANNLPTLDGAGALVAAETHSRSVVQFNANAYKKARFPNFRCKATFFLLAGGTSGHAVATVDFMYVCTNTSTGAGVLRVLNVEQGPAASNYITGLYFISGVTGGTEFRIAIAGGWLSTTPAADLAVSLEVEHFMALTGPTNDYVNNGFVSTPVTANDVTDAIDLLTVADTII